MRTTGNPKRALGRGRLRRRDAEALLDAAGGLAAAAGEDATGSEDLAWLLDAAAGPALAAELSGEEAARAVFTAHHSRSEASEERRVFKTMLAKAAGVKIAAVVCGVSLVGVATAAATNTLPSGLQNAAHNTFGAPAPKGADKDKDKDKGAASASSAKPTGTAASSQAKDDDQDKKDADGAKFLGDEGFRLCKAAENGDKDDQGKDLDEQDLQKLAKAAGIPDSEIAKIKSKLDAERAEAQKQMQAFCNRLAQAEKDLRDGKTPKFPIPVPHPGDGWPTTWPSGLPTKLPSGLPTKLPSGFPSKFPTSLPSGIPTNWPSGWPVDPQNPVDPQHNQPSVPMPSGSFSISGSGSLGNG